MPDQPCRDESDRDVRRRNAIPCCSLLVALFLVPGFLEATTYNCTTFSISGAAVNSTGLNNAGFIVGYYSSSGSLPYHGFVRDNSGNIVTYDYPGSISTQLFTMNNHGTIAGQYTPGGGGVIAFTLQLTFSGGGWGFGDTTSVILPSPYDSSSF